MDDESKMARVGTWFHKEFDGVIFRGAVMSYNPPYYEIVYEDGDVEEMSLTDLKKLLATDRQRIRVAEREQTKKENGANRDELKESRAKRQKIRDDVEPPCRVPGSVEIYFGGLRPMVVELQGCSKPKQSFLNQLFDNSRILMTRQEVSSVTKQTAGYQSASHFQQFGAEYSLLTTTIHEEKGFSQFNRKRFLECYYIATSGLGLEPINLKKILERIGDFGCLPSVGKIASRLELFRSPAISNRPPCSIDISEIEVIDDVVNDNNELMADGCGFISDEMIERLLGGKAQKHLAIQVRVWAPLLGIFKGALCRKPGIRGIQLARSMRKVGPSKIAPETDTWAIIVINQQFPSTNNVELGKVRDGIASKRGIRARKLTSMITNLWSALGVDKFSIEKHVTSSSPKHSWMIGLADPTGQIPSGKVFVTGFTEVLSDEKINLQQVFVTRSPCVKLEDGRLVSAIQRRPIGMSHDNWEFLKSLPIGGLIFSSLGDTPLPLTCAQGDLDGDLYLVCWNPEIVKKICPRVILTVEPTAKAETKKLPVKKEPAVYNKGWFEDVQRHYVDGSCGKQMALVGKLYKLMEKLYEERGMEDSDGRLLADAYLTALDNPKHGGKIKLPDHLMEALKLAH